LTEIPEHLLKRSKAARAGSAGGADGGDAAPGTAVTPAAAAAPVARAAAPVVPKVEAVKPDAPYVQAAKSRQRIPVWAMSVVAILPVWGFMYFHAVNPAPKTVTGPLAGGAAVYSKCASCHGSAGAGGVGYSFLNNSLWQTFPTIEEQIRYVYQGTKGFQDQPYGNPDRPGGQRIGGAKGVMPLWGSSAGGELSDAELVEVICHERHTLAKPSLPELKEAAEAELEAWCSPEGEKWLEVEEAGLEEMGVDISAAV
jgi:mono/diheme cytochrome c family protein